MSRHRHITGGKKMRADQDCKDDPPSRVRTILDVLVPTLLVWSSLGVIWLTLPSWRQQPVNGPAVVSHGDTTPADSLPLAPPTPPQSLEGAELLGDARTARVAIIEFSDFECRFCATFARQTWPDIKKDYVDTGKVLKVFRPVAPSSSQSARRAARSALCAANQGRFWQMHDRLFEGQGRIGDASGPAVVKDIGLDRTLFDDCMKDESDAKVKRNVEIARSIGVLGTPTFLIGQLGRDRQVTIVTVLQGVEPYERFKEILDELLEKTSVGS
jgi:protein-disulfide isomerase